MAPPESKELARQILEALVSGAQSPSDVVRRFAERIKESEVRRVIWRLIDGGEIEVTQDGLLQKAS